MRSNLVLAVLLCACGDNTGSESPDARQSATRFAYVNFEGIELSPGTPDAKANTTTIVSSPTMFPPFLAGRANREEILAGIVDEAGEILAPYDIDLSRERPADRYMMIVFSTTSTSLGLGQTTGVAQPSCGIGVGYASGITTLYEFDNTGELTATQLTHAYASSIVAQIGLAYGVPDVTTPLDCMCWKYDECYLPPAGERRCELGMAMQSPDWPCTSDVTIDTAAIYAAKLGAHP